MSRTATRTRGLFDTAAQAVRFLRDIFGWEQERPRERKRSGSRGRPGRGPRPVSGKRCTLCGTGGHPRSRHASR